MAARLVSHQSYRSTAKTDSAKDERLSSVPFLLNLSNLTQQAFHAYLHNTILSNITYYKALARYRHRKHKLIIYTDGRRHKNEKAFYRLTETGLRLLKTGFSKKPKNPV